MKTDPHFYKVFEACPELFAVFAPLQPQAGYHFSSRVYKDINRTYDGIFEPRLVSAPVFIVEFQNKTDKGVYPRLFLEMAGYQLAQPAREVRGVLIFITERADPKPRPWHGFSRACDEGFRVVYLDQVLAGLSPAHPLRATFTPLVTHPDQLKDDAASCLQTIRHADLEASQKSVLERVFVSWIAQIFKTKTRKELKAMFGFETPIEETTFYKEVFHDGKAEGKVEGKVEGKAEGKVEGKAEGILEGEMRSIDGQIAELTKWHAEGILPTDVFQGKVAELREKHASLAARYKKLAT